MEYRGVDYVQDINIDNMLVVAGSDGYKANIRLITEKD